MKDPNSLGDVSNFGHLPIHLSKYVFQYLITASVRYEVAAPIRSLFVYNPWR